MSSINGTRVLKSGRIATSGRVISTRNVKGASRQDGAMRWVNKGLVGYYRADDGSNIILTGGKVSQWNDLSGNLNHMTQSSSARRPLFSGSGVTFSGSNVLQLASNLQVNSNNITVGGVFVSTNNSGSRDIFRPSVTGGVSLTINTLGTGKRELFVNGVGQTSDGNATTNTEVWVVTGTATSGGTQTDYKFYLGTSGALQSLSVNPIGKVNPSGSLSLIGAANASGTFGMVGSIYELFFVSRQLNIKEITAYLEYVTQKYGAL